MKSKIKIATDILMTAALLLLMAYQIVGDTLHEWFGAGILSVSIFCCAAAVKQIIIHKAIPKNYGQYESNGISC